MKRIVFAIICILFLAVGTLTSSGCNKFMPEAKVEDKIEVGLYNSILTAEKTYSELVVYARTHEHLFSPSKKELIEDVSKKYTQSLITALTSWHAYKLYGSAEDLNIFIEHANLALREVRTLYLLIKPQDNEETA